MKRFLVLSAVCLATLAASALRADDEKTGQHKVRQRQGLEARHGQDANTPPGEHRPRMRNRMEKMFEERVSKLEAIRAIAAEEGAKKTVAALDEMIGEEKGRLEKMQARRAEMEERMKDRDERPRRPRPEGRRLKEKPEEEPQE
jgi:uncharacterized coiled-coil protein SlyX